ncbi:vacuolar protein sorting-associated protein 11 [Entomortierella parvispora]|uniref:E3 ubiquitin-protein ligase PEP5 n=1 Tax=Entomortierella parvispora TaxID=205924 RepID=A0A9P3HL55_9FUNG|nr:vacuolar protein sorting-associated protein 11 [Entomortierella parvispora]
MALQRQFNFFDKVELKDPEDPTKSPEIFQSIESNVATSGRGHMVVADRSGVVHIIDKNLKVESFLAYESGRITHMKQLRQRNILVTVGEEDNAVQVIKLWDLDKPDRVKTGPTLERSIRVQQTKDTFPVSALAVLENLSQIAVGLANGVVVLINGDLMRERTTAQKIVHQNDEPITGLGFKEQQKGALLFIATTSKVLLYNTFTKHTQTLDDQGGGLGCAVMNEASQELAIARDEAIFFYGADGRGPAYAFDGPKTFISFYKSYLVLVSPPNITTAASRQFGVNASAVSANDTTRLTIIDTLNKFTAYQATFSQGIRSVICEWGSIHIVENGGKVYRLDEMDTSVKLDILFKKNMYLLAINLAHNQKYDNASISDIIKKYGDHLYTKGDYDGAMGQYVRTIGRLEPSYVIRKFLDAQRIYNLTSYLQELHSSGLANADHTTLLLNCYTKLKDVKRLDEFIKTDSDLMFDLETAIQVCRQAGYYEHAVYLAEKFEEHDLYLTVQIDDVKNYEKALAYMRRLGSKEADKNLQKYGKVLLTHLPEKTTQLLVDLCSGFLTKAGSPSPTPGTVTPAGGQPGLNNLPFAMAGSPVTANLTANAISSPRVISQTVFQPKSKGGQGDSVKYSPPSPRTFMSLFVDLPSYLITFLEQVSANRWPSPSAQTNLTPAGASAKSPTNAGGRPNSIGSVNAVTGSKKAYDSTDRSSLGRSGLMSDQDMEERKAVWNTLFELYLAHNNTGKESMLGAADLYKKMRDRNINKEKCLRLLNDTEISYDMNHALVLCHLAEFDEGIVFLYERMKMYTDILRLWIGRDDTTKVIECLRKYGPLEPSLYPLTLSYFSSSPGRLTSATPELLKVLDHIDQQDLLPPLQVVQALSQTSVATIGMIKNYIGRRIEAEKKERAEDQKQIQSYRQESENKRREIEDLKTSARIFQVTKCSSCGGSLDLPSVHFLCRHSFHQRCLADSADRECPKCMIEQRTVADIRRMQEANAEKHDLFLSELEDADDGFEVIAKYFGNNTMAFAKLIDSSN